MDEQLLDAARNGDLAVLSNCCRMAQMWGPQTRMEIRLSTWPAMGGHLEVGDHLASRGANVEAKNSCGETPLWSNLTAAFEEGEDADFCKVALCLLTSHGANPAGSDNGGITLLHYACGCGQLGLVRCLLTSHAVDVNATDSDGQTPFFWAFWALNNAEPTF